jgi:ParB family transcriptional regulator, chromosome partitioning protein
VAEFDDDREDSAQAVEVLLEAAEHSPERFEHVAQRLRDDREERRLIAEHTQTLTGQGLRVLTDDEASDATELYRLRPTVDSPQGTHLDPEEHTSCPGHAVHLAMRMDWSTNQKRIEAAPHCTEAHRHAPRYNRDTGSVPAPELTNEQAEAAKERKRAERRRVIDNNKAWESATAQRRRWLAEFIARKKPATDAAAFIALTLARGSHDVRKAMESGSPTACALLGLPEPAGYYSSEPRPLVEAAKTATGVRATQLSLAVLLGAYEDGTSRESWRSPTRETAAYFTALRDWRYPLSDVECLVLDPDADQTHEADQTDESGDQADDTDEVGDDTEEPR